MGIDLKKLTAKQALSLAKSLSGRTNEELAEILGQDHSSVKRYFNENDQDYFPCLCHIPKICRALGNTILMDWIQAHSDEQGQIVAIDSDNDLLRRVNRLASELGGVHRVVDDTLSSAGLDRFDPECLLSGLFEVERQVRGLRRSLHLASGGEIDASGGWETAVAKGD